MSRQRSMETIARAEYVTIGELVRLTDVRYSTLKFYTEQGLLPFEQAEENLTRRYRRAQSVERIRLLRRLRAEGRTIAEVKSDCFCRRAAAFAWGGKVKKAGGACRRLAEICRKGARGSLRAKNRKAKEKAGLTPCKANRTDALERESGARHPQWTDAARRFVQ